MTEPAKLTVDIDGVTWTDGDIGLATTGEVVQLACYGYAPGLQLAREVEWYWDMFGGGEPWPVFSDGKPYGKPVQKMRLVPVEESSDDV